MEAEHLSRLVKYTRAEQVGPGVWLVIHMMSRRASRDEILQLIRHIRKRFPCLECRGHFNKMCDKHLDCNLEDSRWFYNMYNFHRMVNDRLHKITPSYETVDAWYSHDNLLSDHSPNNPFNCTKNSTGLWWLLHSTAQHSRELFETIWKLLRKHYNCFELPLLSTSRDEYPDFVWDIHSTRNRKIIPKEQVVGFFEKGAECREGCSSQTVHHSSYISPPV